MDFPGDGRQTFAAADLAAVSKEQRAACRLTGLHRSEA
jgi:hypothetical protein